MKIDKKQYLTLKDSVIIYSKEYVQKEDVEKFEVHIVDKIKNFNPTLMVYGVYNAGKSTLINAIYGKEEMAKTGDSPETSNIYDYNYNGYTIYDTPGINAPQEHEDVTQEHRAKCEVILFVISNDGSFEEVYVYEKIAEIIKEKKPLLIVLNNKSGIDMNSIEAIAEIDKVNFHLSNICDEKGIKNAEEQVSVVFVDAQTALEGKIEEEEELIQESNIEFLENKIDELLGKSGNTEVTNALNIYISKYINQTIEIIDSKIDNPEIRKTQELISYFEKFRQRVSIELKNIAMQSVATATSNLFELMLARDTKGIEKMIKKITGEVMQNINKRLKEINSEIKSQVDSFKVEFEKIAIATPTLSLSMPNIDTTQQQTAENSDNKALINSTASTVIMAIPPIVPIGPVVIPVKVIATVALALYNIFAGSDEAKIQAEAKLDAKRQQYLSAKNQTDEFGMRYKDNLIESIDKNLEQLFMTLINDFKTFSKKLESEELKLLNDKNRLEDILHQLQ